MDNVVVRDLIDAGIHFGHRAGRWNPKMKPYVFCTRNSIHIINIKETIRGILRAQKFLASIAASGKEVLFVGTKRQARQVIRDQSTRCGMPFVVERWLGGTLTNFRTIRSRLSRLEELEDMETKGLLAAESKKMESTLRREMRKITRNLEGIRKMNGVPGALVIVDARREHLAVHEARKLKVPTVCLLDTDSDPDLVDIAIPGNDDAMGAIDIILGQLADAIEEGKASYTEGADQVDGEGGGRVRSRRLSTTQVAEAMSGVGPASSQVADAGPVGGVTEPGAAGAAKPADSVEPTAQSGTSE